MISHTNTSWNSGSVFIRFAQKVLVLIFLFLFPFFSLFALKEAAAQSIFRSVTDAPYETDEAKADFLFKQPESFLGIRLGFFSPRASSDLFDTVTRELTIEKSDFRTLSLGLDFGFNLLERIDLIFRCDFFDKSTNSEFRDYVDQSGLPITQTTVFSQLPVTVGVKYLFITRGRSVGRYAWLPNRFVPFVEIGGGVLWYSFHQYGDFVDSGTLEIFRADLESSGWAPVGYLGGGLDIYLYGSAFLTFDLRYAWAEDDLDGEFTGFDPIDLSGFRTTAGINWHF